MRVLHCPTDVGGHAGGLARAEQKLGIDSTTAVFSRSWLEYSVDIDLALGGRGRLGRLAGRMRFSAKAARGYDVFHFNFGQSLLPAPGGVGIDLPLLRALGKRLFVTFQGCDARQNGYCRDHYAVSCCGGREGDGLCRAADDAGKRRRIRYLARHSRGLFCLNPDLLRVVPGGEFVPYASCDPGSIEPIGPTNGSRVTILHAPTNRAVKGTDEILAAAKELDDRYDIEWLMVENVPHAEAMRLYERADLVIDQLRIGWYGGFAVEMMAMGKPVVCHIRTEDLGPVPPEMARELPLVPATPQDLHEVLAGLAADRARLVEIGARSRRFVERWHDPARIAEAMLRLYRDPARTFWEVFEREAA